MLFGESLLLLDSISRYAYDLDVGVLVDFAVLGIAERTNFLCAPVCERGGVEEEDDWAGTGTGIEGV